MNIVWKRTRCKGLPSSRSACTHGVQTFSLTPRLRAYLDGRSVILWTIGPAIRQCCVQSKSSAALASWWSDIEARFEDLRRDGSHPFADGILNAKQSIITALRVTVPRTRNGATTVVRRARIPVRKQLAILGLDWPCSADDVRKRWRQLALDLHPDRGGRPDLFLAANAAQREVLKYLEPNEAS